LARNAAGAIEKDRARAVHNEASVTGHAFMPPIAPERLSELIGLIYDCIIEPDRWPETMHDICVDLGCFVGTIYLVELESSRIRFFQEAIAMLDSPGKDLTAIYSTSLVVRAQPRARCCWPRPSAP